MRRAGRMTITMAVSAAKPVEIVVKHCPPYAVRYMQMSVCTIKLHYMKPQGTVNGSICPRFEINHIHLFALIVAGSFTVVR